MKRAVLFAICIVTFVIQSWSQKSLNSYKYIIIPERYDFLKSNDQYQVNSLTLFLFEREGFNVVYGAASFPDDLSANGCLGLRLNVTDESGMFSTKLKIKLIDCKNSIVHETKFGTSRNKDYKKAYHEAIRMAFEEFESLNYSYNAALNNSENQTESTSDKVEIAKAATAVVAAGAVKETKALVDKPKLDKNAVSNNVAKVEKPAVAVVAAATINTSDNSKSNEVVSEPENLGEISLEASYTMGNWGVCAISKKDNYYVVIGGDENFEFGTVYPTSKPDVFIIKWAAFKQPQLLQFNRSTGNLVVDKDNGTDTYLRVNQ